MYAILTQRAARVAVMKNVGGDPNLGSSKDEYDDLPKSIGEGQH